jgi:hypothetical protein
MPYMLRNLMWWASVSVHYVQAWTVAMNLKIVLKFMDGDSVQLQITQRCRQPESPLPSRKVQICITTDRS